MPPRHHHECYRQSISYTIALEYWNVNATELNQTQNAILIWTLARSATAGTSARSIHNALGLRQPYATSGFIFIEERRGVGWLKTTCRDTSGYAGAFSQLLRCRYETGRSRSHRDKTNFTVRAEHSHIHLTLAGRNTILM